MSRAWCSSARRSPTSAASTRTTPQLLEQGARLVFVNGTSESLPITSVGVDERASGRIATEHLLELGHRRIGFVAGEAFALATREKGRGREAALHASGVDADAYVAYAGFSVEGGRQGLRRIVEEANGDRPTAVICSNDLMAIGAMQEAAALGLRVPDDLSIVGFDGIDAAAWTQPPLTTVEQPIDEIARTAIEALQALVDGPAQRASELRLPTDAARRRDDSRSPA